MKIISKIISYLIAFLLMLSIFASMLTYLATSTLLKEEYVLGKLEENGYYENLYHEIQSKFEEYILQSGLEEEVIRDIYTEDQVQSDTKILIHNIYAGTDQEINITAIKEKLNKNIESSLGTTKTHLTSAQKIAIEKFVDTIGNAYQSQITASNTLQKVSNNIPKINSFINKAKIMIYFIPIGLCLFIILFNLSNLSQVLKYIGIAGVASGILAILPNVLINAVIKIENITLISENFSIVIRSIIINLLQTITTYGTVAIVLGIILIILATLLKKEKRQNKHAN